MGTMRHVVAVVRIAAAIISLWRHRHPISVGVTTAMQPISVAVATAATHTALVTPARPTVVAANSRWVDIGSRQTLLVLHFLIEFDNIWAQYSPWTCASTHVGFFLICVIMSKWWSFKVGIRRNFPYFSIWNRDYGRLRIQKGLHTYEDRCVPAYQIWLWSINRGRL